MKLNSYTNSRNQSKSYHEGELYGPLLRHIGPNALRLEMNAPHVPGKISRTFEIVMTMYDMATIARQFAEIVEKQLRDFASNQNEKHMK